MRKRGWAMLGGLGLGAGLLYVLNPNARGIWSEASGAFGAAEDDDVLAARVRGRLRQVVGDPDAVEVAVEDGLVTLTGTVGATEFDRLVSAVLKVRGVRDVADRLQVRAAAAG
jgi:osmotically-inducible protein OsmY